MIYFLWMISFAPVLLELTALNQNSQFNEFMLPDYKTNRLKSSCSSCEQSEIVLHPLWGLSKIYRPNFFVVETQTGISQLNTNIRLLQNLWDCETDWGHLGPLIWNLGNFGDYGNIIQDFIRIYPGVQFILFFFFVSDSFEKIVHPLLYNNTFLHPCSDSIGFSICCQYVSWSSCLIIYTFNHHR